MLSKESQGVIMERVLDSNSTTITVDTVSEMCGSMASMSLDKPSSRLRIPSVPLENIKEESEDKGTKEVLTLNDQWMTLYNHLLVVTQQSLALLAPREFDGDPNNGITEMAFKLLFLSALANLSSGD